MVEQSVKDRIRKLLAIGANGSGATESEQYTAMQMASLMMAQHGIEQSELGGEKSTARFGEQRKERMLPYKLYSAMAAGTLYGCTFIMHNKGLSGLTFIGRPDNIDATEATFAWIVAQIDTLYKGSVPRDLSGNSRQAWVEKFRVACATRVWSRAVEAVKAISKPATSGGTALVAVRYFDSLAAENKNVLATIVTKNANIGGIGKWTDGSNTGYRAGDQVKLRKEVNQPQYKQIAG